MKINRFFLFDLLTVLILPTLVFAQISKRDEDTLIIRGKRQNVYFYPAVGKTRLFNHKILFASGDGGWRGFAVTVAKTVASWGYDVYGLDTKRYLESFTGKSVLKETDVMADFREIAKWMPRGIDEKVILIGHSEGADLCLLAAASDENKGTFNGVVFIGLSEFGILGWRWSDDITYITKKLPKEPTFKSVDFLPKVSPLPLMMIQSNRDEYVSVEAARRLFSTVREPKRFISINSQNHSFDGKTAEFFRALRNGIEWITETFH